MYSAPTGYKEVAQSTDRVEALFMSMGVYIDNTAADDISGYSGSSLPMSNNDELTDATYEMESNLATFEGDGIPTSVESAVIVPPLAAEPTMKTGWWSNTISDGSGLLDTVLTISLSSPHTSALTIYTDGPNILEGEVTFSNNGTETTVELDCHAGYAVATGANTYDSITITITKIDQNYKHLRIVELEFGDSITISTTTLSGQVTYIDEIDPLGQGMPMKELDFDLINVNGEYDEDNPNSLFTRLAIGNPINLSYTIMGNGKQFTIPMGRFVLAEKRPNGNCLSVVAYDVRWYLSQMYNSWSISPSEDLGTTIDRLLDTVELAHTIDEDVYEVYPTVTHTFTTDTTVLEDIQAVIQAYGLVFVSNRAGTILVQTDYVSEDYELIPPTMQFAWPETNQMNRYNYIDIYYGSGQHYSRDLRPTLNTAKIVISVNNSLIATEAQAITICNRIASKIYSKAVTLKWASDPVLDLYDEVDVYSVWTLNGTPATYKAVKREITFDGMLKEETTLIQ